MNEKIARQKPFARPAISDDNETAFMQLEAEFRDDCDVILLIEDTSAGEWNSAANRYINRTMTASRALDIGLPQPPTYDDTTVRDQFDNFREFVDAVLIEIRISQSRRSKAMSVGLTPDQKTNIHALCQKIRDAIDESLAPNDKKEKLFKIIADLVKEVDQPRTGLERFGDLARGLADISRYCGLESKEPWWKWHNIIMGSVDDAKETELLPNYREALKKRLEPPQRQLPKPD